MALGKFHGVIAAISDGSLRPNLADEAGMVPPQTACLLQTLMKLARTTTH